MTLLDHKAAARRGDLTWEQVEQTKAEAIASVLASDEDSEPPPQPFRGA